MYVRVMKFSEQWPEERQNRIAKSHMSSKAVFGIPSERSNPVGCTTRDPISYRLGVLQGQHAKAGLVDDFKKKFNALKIPLPKDKYTVQVDTEEKEDVKSCAEFVSLSKARTEEYQKPLEKMKNIVLLIR
ncbi:ATP synthase subunit d, mitochondrial [Tupaia chinensis]|uniref:ATP synthase subunit d, mitochondrial n=1 Tax=Tupaia chinensis TaxID=246437 RepID=L9L4Q0_TUPCH|nr:ATP synthase subunit d, mitochondrial [Tupaia chinensis]